MWETYLHSQWHILLCDAKGNIWVLLEIIFAAHHSRCHNNEALKYSIIDQNYKWPWQTFILP